MTKNLVFCCIKKSKLYKRAQSSGMEEDKSKFLAYRNKLKSILKKAKKKFFHDQITAAAGNIKNTWKILNWVTKKTQTPLNTCFKINSSYTSDAGIIANNFNTFFSNIGSMLAANIPNNSIPFTNYLKDSIPNSCVFWNTDVKEVICITTQCENKKSAGYDEIPMSLLRLTIDAIAPALVIIFNMALSTGFFPDNLKIAKVIPIYKTGDKDSLNNYRPISLLPSVSKILETIIQIRMLSLYLNIKS